MRRARGSTCSAIAMICSTSTCRGTRAASSSATGALTASCNRRGKSIAAISFTRSARRTAYCVGWSRKPRSFASSSAARRRSSKRAFPSCLPEASSGTARIRLPPRSIASNNRTRSAAPARISIRFVRPTSSSPSASRSCACNWSVGVDRVQLQRVVTYGLQLAGAPPLHVSTSNGGPQRFEFRAEEVAEIKDAALGRIVAALREPTDRFGTGPLRPISFDPPPDTDARTVQLHLEHPLVTRLIDRFSNQGLVHHQLSRACLAVAPDAVPRVVLMGRLSLWGSGAARLHEEIVRLAARWVEPEIRRAKLRPYSGEAERQTIDSLDRALDEPRRFDVPEGVRARLLATLSRDVAELLPELERRAEAAAEAARNRLHTRGREEAAALRALIAAQRRRIERELARLDDPQFRLALESPEEQRQRELDIRAWRDRLENIASEIGDQPARILAGYDVRARRLEPVGIVYLWPATV